jgi:hypothetical protein
MDTVDAALLQLQGLLGTGSFHWSARQFGHAIPVLPEWTGSAADHAHAVSAELDSRRRVLEEAFAAVTPIVAQADAAAAVARRRIDGIRAQWLDEKAALGGFAAGSRGMAALMQLGQARIGEATQVIHEAQRVFRELAGQIRDVADRLPRTAGGGGALQVPVDAVPSWGTPPAQVSQWWDSKTREQKDALIAAQPDRVGNLDGIPAVDRDAANRTMLAKDLHVVESIAAARHASAAEVEAHPQDYGLDQTDVVRYSNALEVREGLARNHSRTGSDTFLLIYKPEAFNGQGRAAIAINNPDQASYVAVTVPGTSHSVAEGWLAADDSANVYNELKAVNPQGNSVIAWMGYDAPDGFTDARIASTPLAHAGAALLAGDVTGFKSTSGADFTVIGHSYGSTVVADAAYLRMPAHDVVLIGSPGTDMAHSASDFHLPAGGGVYVGSASTDPITQLGKMPTVAVPGHTATIGLGSDPAAEGFGSIRFRAEVPGITVNDHSHYYQPGSESLRSIGLIASGHGATALHDQGLLAPHRADPSLVDRVVGTLMGGAVGAVEAVWGDLELSRLPKFFGSDS